MRETLHPAVEHTRIEEQGSGRQGVFSIPGPSGRRLLVIASDGSDWEAAGLEGDPWEHVSLQAVAAGRTSTIPNWKEMCFVKDIFWETDECVVQFHPPSDKYVNKHSNVLHLWRCTTAEFPMPPQICV